MSNFNQFFRNQGAKIIVDKFLSGIDAYSSNELTELTWKLAEEPKDPASYYIENGLTATHKVLLEYTVNYDGEIRYSEFEVPREIDGAFIIEGAYRVATNTLGNDFDCRINMSGAGRYYINFDYDREYDINKGVLKIKRVNPELGLPEKVREIGLNEVDSITGLERETLKLSEKQRKKFQVKLDLDYDPEYISKRLIDDCIAFGDDRVRDMIIDKKIESVSAGFINYLLKGSNGRNYWGTRKKIQNYWTKNGKLKEQMSTLTMMCARYWKGSSDTAKGGSDLRINPGVNAINLQSMTSKIQIPPTVAYNASFSDLICVGATPINQNVGKQNALTVSTHVEEDGVYFDVYDTSFNKVTLPYLDYLNKKVCSSESVDYENSVMVPDNDGLVECKYRMKRIKIPVSEVELIDLHPDARLSEEVRRIPFINYTDSVRIHMGSSMLKQSIPLVNAERPLVDTGNSEELRHNVLNEVFKEDKGVVKEISEKAITIELPNKDTIKIPRRTAIQSVNDVNVYTEPKVKVGQKLKRGDVITGAVNLENDTYKSGINTLVLFHAMHGLVNEDALVVSESFAQKMKSYSFVDLCYDVKITEALKWIAPIGTRVKSKDPVITVNKAVRLDEVNRSLQEKLGGLLEDSMDYVIENNVLVPNNISEAYVSDIIIQENKKPKIPGGVKPPDLTFSKLSKPTIDEVNDTKDEWRKAIYERYPEYIASDTLDPVNLSDKSYKIVYTVRIRLVSERPLVVGSKLTNRYGGKGVISKIIPDNEMPVMVEKGGAKRVVDAVMNPYSTINRKIPSVNMETLLGNVIHRIYDTVEKMKNDPKKKEKILPFLEKYYPGRFTSMSIDDFIKKHNSSRIEDMYYMNVGSYSTKYTPELIDKWAKELGAEPQSRILMPAKTLADLEELRKNLEPDEYESVVKGMKGKYTEVNRELSVGWMTMICLYHIPYLSQKVTSSMFGVDINEYKDEPILGGAAYRVQGQKIGEMELSALLARGAKDFIDVARGDTARVDSQEFLNNLLGLGLTVTDSKGYNQGGSGLKERMENMKVKFRLKNSK